MNPEDQLELRQVGVDRRLHVRILQLAGHRPAVDQPHLVDLTQRCGGGGLERKLGKSLAPVGPKLGHHSPTHERLAHRRRVALQLGELGRILGGQRVRYGGDQLRHLHQRTLQPAQRLLELDRVRAVERAAHQPGTRHAGRLDADCTPHLGIAANAGAQAVLARYFAGGRGRVGHARSGMDSSSWSISPSSRRRPLAQNPGSEASRPNGASSSLCRKVPPARSSSR